MIRDNFNFGTMQAFDSLIEIFKERKCILFAGSGLSKQFNDRFPDWKTLINNMANLLKGNVDDETMEIIGKLIDQNRLLEAAEACRRRISTQQYVQFFQQELQGPLSSPVNRSTHVLITEIPFIAVLTTNYDQLLEKIYQEEGKDIPIYTQKDAPSLGTLLQPRRQPDEKRPNFILKAHGDLTKPDTWVLTSDDYRKIIMRNPAYRLLMRNLLTQFSILFVGFTLTDQDFQLLLQDVMDAFEGEIPDHFLLLPELNYIEQEVLYRTYHVRVLPYKEFIQLPNFLSEIKIAIDLPPATLPDSPNLEQVRKFVKQNENFEDPIHRRETLTTNLSTILQIVNNALANPNLDIDALKSLIEIERILTHHVYLFPEIKIRKEYAPKLISKAIDLFNKGIIKNFKNELGDHAWMLYLTAVEDIGFPLVRQTARDDITGDKNKDILKDNRRQLEKEIQRMKQIFNLTPRDDSSGEELRAACYYNRIRGLELINLQDKISGFSYLNKALKLAQKAKWESIEAALLQDIVRPEPNPWADQSRISNIKRISKEWANDKARIRESIELARYKGMHRRVIGGLIGLSLLTDGDEKSKNLKYASDYYLLHQVDQEPLEAMIFAEETFALDDIGYLTRFETEYRINWLKEKQKNYGDKFKYELLPLLFQNKLRKILNAKF